MIKASCPWNINHDQCDFWKVGCRKQFYVYFSKSCVSYGRTQNMFFAWNLKGFTHHALSLKLKPLTIFHWNYIFKKHHCVKAKQSLFLAVPQLCPCHLFSVSVIKQQSHVGRIQTDSVHQMEMHNLRQHFTWGPCLNMCTSTKKQSQLTAVVGHQQQLFKHNWINGLIWVELRSDSLRFALG